jgi:protein TonB
MRKKIILLIALFFTTVRIFAQEGLKDLPETLKARLSRTQAEFPGGPEKMKKFIEKNKRYQNKEHKLYGAGIVYVGFIVEKDGSLDSLQILQPLTEYYNQEALRLIKSMPKWKPATEQGAPLRTQFSFPIKF